MSSEVGEEEEELRRTVASSDGDGTNFIVNAGRKGKMSTCKLLMDNLGSPVTFVGAGNALQGLGHLILKVFPTRSCWPFSSMMFQGSPTHKAMCMVLPALVSIKVTKKLQSGVRASCLNLTVTQMPRKHCLVGISIEFYGMCKLCPANKNIFQMVSQKYGATTCFFGLDYVPLEHIELIGQSEKTPSTGQTDSYYLELDLCEVVYCVSGLKRLHDRVPFKEIKSDWHACLDRNAGFKWISVHQYMLIDQKCSTIYAPEPPANKHYNMHSFRTHAVSFLFWLLCVVALFGYSNAQPSNPVTCNPIALAKSFKGFCISWIPNGKCCGTVYSVISRGHRVPCL